MEEFRGLIRVLTMASLGLAAMQIYLTVNKLWSRKHEKVVAESISIYGELLGLVPLSFLTFSFVLDGQWEGVFDGFLWIMAGTVTISIGTGMWVEGRRGRGFWSLLLDAMALERSEVGDLARSFFRPSRPDQILELLARVALIDNDLDDREQAFIHSFAEAWGISIDLEAITSAVESDGVLDTIELRDAVARYLTTSPPTTQVEQLGDVIVALVHVDEEVTSEEGLILVEIGGMLEAYIDGEVHRPRFALTLVPQTEAQDVAIQSVLPETPKEQIAGGSAYVVGRYFSEAYAELVGKQYEALNVFTTVLRSDTAARELGEEPHEERPSGNGAGADDGPAPPRGP